MRRAKGTTRGLLKMFLEDQTEREREKVSGKEGRKSEWKKKVKKRWKEKIMNGRKT